MLTYQQAMDWLYSFIDSERKLPANALDFNLPRMTALLRELNDPQECYPAVVVAGTKGKGSTCAQLEAILRAAGLRTGLFTSPHLHSYRERMQVDRRLPTQAELVALVERIQPAVKRLDPALGRLSTYELGVGLGLSYFAERAIDIAVLEIGLGGRYDAINAVPPLLSLISSISYDHTAVLGDTLAAIAGEKAGIIKPDVPVLTTVQHPEAAVVIAERAAQQNAPLFIATISGVQERATGELAPYPLEIVPAALALRGEFQLGNAQLAVGAAMLLREIGLPITDEEISAGLLATTWPGRLETVGHAPTIVVDGAHNGDSARALGRALRQEFQFERLILVLGVSADKDIAAIAQELVPAAAELVLTRSPHPRSMATADLRELAAPLATGAVRETPEVAAALDLARELAGPADLICVTGSLFVVAAAREALGLAQAD